MAAQALPPPQSPGPSPGGGPASPAPASPNPQAAQLLSDVHAIVAANRRIAQSVPGAAQIVREINELVQKLQMKIIQSQPSSEAQAPPI